jgi:hypothetical protein
MKVEIGPYEYYEGKNRVVDVTIDKYDTWNLDHTLALVILPALKQFRSKLSGAPKVDDSDVPENLRSTSAPAIEEWETDENWFKRWDYVLDEMINAFELIVEDDDYKQENNAHVLKNGLRLFGKYYLHLWD